jgi:hypothetical protein
MAVLRRLVCVLVLLLVPCGPTSAGAATAPSEYEVKAAFLCSFAEFVEWPPDGQSGRLTVGILGDDPFGRLLDETVANRTMRTKQLEVKRLVSLEEALRCQIVYVSASEAPRLEAILQTLGPESILTVSDISRFAQRGGIIGFTLEQRRVRFEINVEAAEAAKLRISSRLLKLARIVPEGPRKGA